MIFQTIVNISQKKKESINTFSVTDLTEQDIQLVTGYFVHAADLSGPAKNSELAYLWAARVNKEFTNQVKPNLSFMHSFLNVGQ